jgi:hypothetical protein
MYCGKCGEKNSDDAVFCVSCGAKLEGGQALKGNTTIELSQNDKNRKVGIIAVVVIVIAVIGIILGLSGGRGYKAAIKQYIDATFDGDAESIMELIPEEMINYLIEDEGYDDEDELIEELDEELQYTLDSLEKYLGEDWKVSYEILSTEDVTGEDFDDLKDYYEEMGVKVSASKKAEIEVTVKSGETEMSNSADIALIKIGHSWYMDMVSMGSLF